MGVDGRPPAWKDQLGTEKGGRVPGRGRACAKALRQEAEAILEQRGKCSQWLKAFQHQTGHWELILIAARSH